MGGDLLVAALLVAIFAIIFYNSTQGSRKGTFIPNCIEGLTSGSMPSIDEPPPTPCGFAGVAARGKKNCCGGFNVDPNVTWV